MYHGISEFTERSKKFRITNPAYSLSTIQFKEQMRWLSENGYRTLSLDELIYKKTNIYDKSLVITFDDGLVDNYINAFPILKKQKLTATIFVITGFIGKTNYLDWQQLKEMDIDGISIQSHTVSHIPLAGLKNGQLIYELEVSKKSIEDHLGKAVVSLSVPHGMISHKVIDMAQNVGYKAICTTEPGFIHEFGDMAIFKRINISDRCKITIFRKIVETNLITIIPLIISKKIKNLVKRVIGYNNYRKIYRFRYQIKDISL